MQNNAIHKQKQTPRLLMAFSGVVSVKGEIYIS